MSIQLPNLRSPIADKNGQVADPWTAFFSQFGTPPTTHVLIVLTGSPFFYTAKEPGNIFVTGGTVSLIKLFRGSHFITLTGQTIIPVEMKDGISITYSSPPTVQFLPRY